MHYFTLNHILEIPAVIFGIINIYLAARANIWNFLFGFLMCSIYFVLNWRVNIYADMTLQLIFVGFQAYGWYQWRYGGTQHKGREISYAGMPLVIIAILIAGAIFALYAYVLRDYTNSTLIPLDTGATALSIVAQWMMAKKWVENWWLWMIVDVISVAMYLMKGLYLTAGLYSLLFIIAIFGWVYWRRYLRMPRYA